MKLPQITAIALLTVFSATTFAHAVEPIRGSITFTNPDKPRFTKVPAGSQVFHDFRDENGTTYKEAYRVQEDGSVKLLSRYTSHGSNS